MDVHVGRESRRPNDPFGGCSDVTRRQALSGIGAAREKGGSPDRELPFPSSDYFIIGCRPPPSFPPVLQKRNISLSLSRKFLIRYSILLEDRSNDRFQLPISPVPLRKGMRRVEWKGDGSRFALKAET